MAAHAAGLVGIEALLVSPPGLPYHAPTLELLIGSLQIALEPAPALPAFYYHYLDLYGDSFKMKDLLEAARDSGRLSTLVGCKFAGAAISQVDVLEASQVEPSRFATFGNHGLEPPASKRRPPEHAPTRRPRASQEVGRSRPRSLRSDGGQVCRDGVPPAGAAWPHHPHVGGRADPQRVCRHRGAATCGAPLRAARRRLHRRLACFPCLTPTGPPPRPAGERHRGVHQGLRAARELARDRGCIQRPGCQLSGQFRGRTSPAASAHGLDPLCRPALH